MGFLSGVSDALFGDPNQALNAQQKANKRSQEYIQEQTAAGLLDANTLFRQSQQPLQQGYQAAIDALGGTLRQQIDTTARGNYFGQEALLAGMPQFQNAILGMPVNNMALQPRILHPERNLQWLFNTTLGARTGGHNPLEGMSASDIEALKVLGEAGLNQQQIRDLYSANLQYQAQTGPEKERQTIEQIYNSIYGQGQKANDIKPGKRKVG